LRSQENARPRGIVAISIVEASARAEVADALAATVSVTHKFRGHVVQSRQVADRRASHHQNGPVSHESNNAITAAREPELDPRIQDLVRRRVPPEPKNEIARAPMLDATSRFRQEENDLVMVG
jgi:hypothetical protein